MKLYYDSMSIFHLAFDGSVVGRSMVSGFNKTREKHMWKIGMLNVTLLPVCFTYFASVNQLTGFSIGGTLAVTE